ncbi:hypothetical protein J1N35_014287 [Gossypium stocksii]|uniref:Uncharacterized protein n=1 Tax=Gossypium stocksii TaxID=47602 RepID=A0A9D3VW89_9ROSI|nr:hypothetical protein J1N35_014287 [Gossypium stocksii]
MASTQALPSSQKQVHLEAGKRRLEEFHKKKIVEKTKKAASTSQTNVSDVLSERLVIVLFRRFRWIKPQSFIKIGLGNWVG